MRKPIDDLDRRLLGLLRGNARLPVSSLAAGLKVSRATVQKRIDRLIKDGVILGFTVSLDEGADAAPVRAVMSIGITAKSVTPIVKALRGFPEVRAIYTTNGRWDLLCELTAESLGEFDRVLRRVRMIDGVSATETSLLLSSQ
jgi:DNA-binding Lrp family transcriptional regulator